MLRTKHNKEVSKLVKLNKAHEIIKAKESNLREQLINCNSEKYEELNKELNEVCEIEDFLQGEISEFERETGLYLIFKEKGKSLDFTSLAKNALFDIYFKNNKTLYEKFKNNNSDLLDFYFKSFSIFEKVFDSRHFIKLINYSDKGNLIENVRNAKFEFDILDKEYEDRREFNEYKISIKCDNGLVLKIFANRESYSFESVKVHSKDYEKEYSFIGTHIVEINKTFKLFEMMKRIITGIETKTYKLNLK
jgi:hypothetical protein